MLERIVVDRAARRWRRSRQAIGAPSDDVALLLSAIEPAPGVRDRAACRSREPSRDPAAAGRVAPAGRVRQKEAARDRPCRERGMQQRRRARLQRPRPGRRVVCRRPWSGMCSISRLPTAATGSVNEPSDERGRGIHLMNGLMDKVEIEAGAAGHAHPARAPAWRRPAGRRHAARKVGPVSERQWCGRPRAAPAGRSRRSRPSSTRTRARGSGR